MDILWKRDEPDLMLFTDEDDPSGGRLILRVGIEEEPAYVPLDVHNVSAILAGILAAHWYLMEREADHDQGVLAPTDRGVAGPRSGLRGV